MNIDNSESESLLSNLDPDSNLLDGSVPPDMCQYLSFTEKNV